MPRCESFGEKDNGCEILLPKFKGCEIIFSNLFIKFFFFPFKTLKLTLFGQVLLIKKRRHMLHSSISQNGWV